MMHPHNASWRRVLLAIALSLPWLSALAHEGEEIRRLPTPQQTDAPGKIEVIEFFWYGCPYCNKLEPAVENWEKRLPKDVAFRREHVIWDGRADTETHARLFLALRALGLMNKHHLAVYEAIHNSKLRLRSDSEVMDWVAKRGIDRTKFEAAYRSFGINAQMARAKDLTAKYLIDGVPSFAVNGKYVTSLGGSHSPEALFKNVDKLIGDERLKK